MGAQVFYQLEHCGVKYENKYYVQADGPSFDKSAWTDVKFTLGLDFPNLPYFMDGDYSLTETAAIHKYIAAKW